MKNLRNIYIIYLRTPLIPYLEENKVIKHTLEEVKDVLDNQTFFTDYMVVYYDENSIPHWSSGKIDRPLVKRLKH